MNFRHSSENKFQKQLSSKALCAISQKISRDYSPSPDTPSSSQCNQLTSSTQDLLEVSRNISQYYSPKLASNSRKLVILPIDPQHIYVYWNLANNQQAALAESLSSDPLTLKIYLQPDSVLSINAPETVINMPVNAINARETIELPPTKEKVSYSASIGTATQSPQFISLLNSTSDSKPAILSPSNNICIVSFKKSKSVAPVIKYQFQTNYSAKGK